MNRLQLVALWVGIILGFWMVKHPVHKSVPYDDYNVALGTYQVKHDITLDHTATQQNVWFVVVATAAALVTLKTRPKPQKPY